MSDDSERMENVLLKSIEGIVDTRLPERFMLQMYTPLPEGQRLDSCDPAICAPQFVQPSVKEVHEELAKQHAAEIEASSKLLAPDAERDPLEKISHDEQRDKRAERKSGATKVTAGKNWYYLPATKMTPEILAQMQLIHMRKFVFHSHHPHCIGVLISSVFFSLLLQFA